MLYSWRASDAELKDAGGCGNKQERKRRVLELMLSKRLTRWQTRTAKRD